MQPSWRTILLLATQHRRLLIQAHGIAIAAALFAVPVPLLMPLLVDQVLLDKPAGLVNTINRLFPSEWHGPVLWIFATLALAILLRLLAMLCNIWQARSFSTISKDVIYNMRLNLLQHMQRLSLTSYASLGSGVLVARTVTDLETVDQFLGTAVGRLIVAVLTVIGTASVLLWVHWQLGLLLLLLNPLVIFFTVRMGRHVRQLKKKENAAFEAFQNALTETLEGIQQLRASQKEGYFFQRLGGLARTIRNDATRFQWRNEAATRFSFLIFLLGVEWFRAIAMLFVVFSDLSVGMMVAVISYLWFMLGPVQELINMQYAFAAADGALNRVRDQYRLPTTKDYPCQINPFEHHHTATITLRDVHFAYPERPNQKILQGINLHIQAGEKVALVGASGGGKTTLAQLLIGFYELDQGQILYNDVPIQRIGYPCVRHHVATVLQYPVLFNDTIAGNLMLGSECSEQQLWHALTIAQLADTVAAMPEGLQSVIGRQGVRLSGGQKQRLAIARMILTDPKVVVLDEATSALDTATERRLHSAMAEFLAQRTTVIIAHRLSAIQQADRIFLFDQGHLIAHGSHQYLLQHYPFYQHLYGQQSAMELL